ncbi:hypothetical protein CTI14_62975, partial [Methylobacterium radiotolerans]
RRKFVPSVTESAAGASLATRLLGREHAMPIGIASGARIRLRLRRGCRGDRAGSRDNESAFARRKFVPSVTESAAGASLATRLLGREHAMPIGIA